MLASKTERFWCFAALLLGPPYVRIAASQYTHTIMTRPSSTSEERRNQRAACCFPLLLRRIARVDVLSRPMRCGAARGNATQGSAPRLA